MKWKQVSSTLWIAEGRRGKFRIERNKGKFWARYESADKNFSMPPQSKLSEAKEICSDNLYWEREAV